MRSAVLLLTGFVMVVAGVVVAFGVHGGTVPGVALAVVGLVVKGAGFLLGDSTARPGHGPQTLAGRSVERPRAGIPAGRAAMRPRLLARAPAGVVRPLEAAHRRGGTPVPTTQGRRRRRAS